MNFKKGDRLSHRCYGEGVIKSFRGYMANPERDYDTEVKYDFLPVGDRFMIPVFESELTPLVKQNRNTVATTISYLDHIATHTPPEQVNTASEQFLALAEVVTSVHITCSSANEHYPVVKKRYEDITGRSFPDHGDPDPEQGPKCDTLLTMEAALKSGYPICKDKEGSEDAPLYLTKFMDLDDTAHVQGRRAGVVWALLELGYVIGSVQDRTRIGLLIADARTKFVKGK